MKHYVICLITILFGVHAYGQQWRTGNVVVYKGADIEDVIPHSISYFFLNIFGDQYILQIGKQ